MPKVKLTRPKKNSLWSRKDARRPGVVRVTGFRNSYLGYVYVKWQDTTTGRRGEVASDRWHKSYTPFVAPTPTLDTQNDEPGK